MMLKRLLLLSLVVLAACDPKDDGITPCDSKFIVRDSPIHGRFFFYNDFDKLVLITDTTSGKIARTEYSYDVNKKLSEASIYVNGENTQNMHIYFDSDGRFKASTRGSIGGTYHDSTVYTYTNGDVSHVDMFAVGEEAATLTYSFDYLYPEPFKVNLKMYRHEEESEPKLILTSDYVLDGMPLPYPEEYYYGGFYGVPLPLKQNIKSSESVTDTGYKTSVSYTYTYNAAGYPLTSKTEGGSVQNFYYKCEGPKEP